nr:hypothetical protein [Deltaproteobacteria bacterium]
FRRVLETSQEHARAKLHWAAEDAELYIGGLSDKELEDLPAGIWLEHPDLEWGRNPRGAPEAGPNPPNTVLPPGRGLEPLLGYYMPGMKLIDERIVTVLNVLENRGVVLEVGEIGRVTVTATEKLHAAIDAGERTGRFPRVVVRVDHGPERIAPRVRILRLEHIS